GVRSLEESAVADLVECSMRLTLCIVALIGTSACHGPSGPLSTQPPADSQFLAGAVSLYRASRNDNGLYRDRLRFDGAHDGPASVATTGMGLISLCIGSRMGLSTNATAQAKTTVRTMLGIGHARNAAGFYYHFLDMETGSRAGDSEYSSIDTAILMSGALFVASCLAGDAELDSLVVALWESIDWSQAIANPMTGAVYLEMLGDGSGKPGSVTLPFNEYMLVAWLATLADQAGTGQATDLWNRFYANADSLPTSSFAGHVVLTDRPGAFLSSFVIQVAYYLCHPFTTGERYRAFMRSAQRADRAWWQQSTAALDYEWGLGAGSGRTMAYHADAINNNPDHIVSPHIVAGFLPVDSNGMSDLRRHDAAMSRALRSIDGVNGNLLWRYSVSDPSWIAGEIQGIDYSSMMLGLVTHIVGSSFLEEHNDFEAWLARVR
ncbi:MAG: hypothetical protein OER89_14885, partial [Gemmatimonadota bacterium]|nr:hypothetical protein [Gemmatimonadota bacterium]